MSRLPGLVLLLALVSCGGGGGGGSSSPGTGSNNNGPLNDITATGPGVLSVSPLATSTIYAVSPLGALAPPGHVLPTDHIYISFVDPWSGNQQNNDCSKRPVYAAGPGTVMFTLVTEVQGDTKVMVMMTKTFIYYYDHVLLLSNIKVGSKVAAGEQIGTTTGRCPSIDLGVIDLDVNPGGFVNPSRYGDYGAHPASPLKYFTASLRTFYLDHVRIFDGVPADRYGRTDFGIRGKLSGDWFHASLASSPASVINSQEGWIKTLSFAKDWYQGAPRISIGGTITTPGVLAVAAGDPDFASVSVASGVVAFEGAKVIGNIGPGWVLVQMLTDERIRVEYFGGAASRPASFTSAAQEYVR
jgi:hypothetical protein